jgi:SPP1 gp7 family putative phage head morphogenesis protein
MLTSLQRRTEKITEQGPWRSVRNAEKSYARSLRVIARQCCDMIKGMPSHQGADLLFRYSQIIRPWAEFAARRMVDEIMRRDLTAWIRKGHEMHRPLATQARVTSSEEFGREMVMQQAAIIIEMPVVAAQRLADGYSVGRVMRLLETEANTVARREVARVASAVVRLRAYYLGSEGYIWRTARDTKVRPRHRALEGKFFRWSDPPVVDDRGMRGHPGDAPDCRCIPEPVVGEYR